MATWGTKQTATQLATITTEQFFAQVIALLPGEVAHVQIEANPPVTPTDHLAVSLYGTLDDAAYRWDDFPFQTFLISNTIDPGARSVVVRDRYKFRVGVKRSGTTDTFATADMWWKIGTP